MTTKIKNAFSLIELMIVMAIIAFLALIVVPSYFKVAARAKRTEARVNLASLHAAQKAYWVEHGTYTTALSGADSLNWQLEGSPQYTYGFAGTQGVNYVKGKLGANIDRLAQLAKADKNSFVAVAIGDIDGDGTDDVLVINEKGELTVAADDLA